MGDLCPFGIDMVSVGAQQTRDKALIHASLVVPRSHSPCVAEQHYHSF